MSVSVTEVNVVIRGNWSTHRIFTRFKLFGAYKIFLRLFDQGRFLFQISYNKRELDGWAAKYGHFGLRNIVIQEIKFRRMV